MSMSAHDSQREKESGGKATVREARQKRILPCMRGSHFQLREMQSQNPISYKHSQSPAPGACCFILAAVPCQDCFKIPTNRLSCSEDIRRVEPPRYSD